MSLSPKHKKNGLQQRSQYLDHSLQFVHWVDSIGLEKTWLGRVVSQLERRFKVRRLTLVFLFSLVLSSLLFIDFEAQFPIRVGEISSSEIVAPVSFEFTDDFATQEKRVGATLAVPPVFDLNIDTFESKAIRVGRAFRQARLRLRGGWQTPAPGSSSSAAADSLRVDFEKDLGVDVPDRLWEWLVQARFAAKYEAALVRILDQWSELKIVDDPEKFISDKQDRVVIRLLDQGVRSEEFLINRGELRSLGRRSDFDAEAITHLRDLERPSQKNMVRLANLLLVPNVVFNQSETSARQARAREAVAPVLISVKKNQVLVQAGTVIQPSQIAVLREMERLRSSRHQDFISLMAALLLTSLIVVFFSYLKRFTLNRVRVESKDILVMALVTLVVVLISKATIFFASAAFLNKISRILPEEAVLFLAPVASGPMLVGLLINSGEVVWLFTTFMATALGMMVDMNFSFILVSIVGGIAAARGVFNCKTRTSIYLAGVRVGLVNAVMISLVMVVTANATEHILHRIAWAAPAGFLSGILSSLVAMMLIPLLETAFNYTTDVKLMELANLNHPLLKEMIVKAPGTYHHSLVVGSMVESAAEEIGANPLLAKVMAYYHDIGKMEHAAYFIENQRSGHNPHDHLSPHMSKTILIAHVKDGVEMGLQHKLGKPIIDGIWQHHGTTLISYFYNRALETQDKSIDSVSEDDFRYPGPKPQFREAALCMLADSIEAAARALDEPTPGRLQNIVKNIIQKKFMDAQLEECNLTLRDLSIIEEAFNRVLLGIYHQRISYGGAGVDKNSGRQEADGSLAADGSRTISFRGSQARGPSRHFMRQ